jgi:tetratricopeptide (TPR) repeat protein
MMSLPNSMTHSFKKLRALADTFTLVGATEEGRLHAATQRRTLKLVEDLGATAVPLLCRKLRGEDERQASWAYFLLARAGQEHERAISAVRALALDASAADAKKALALALLSELGAELPEKIALKDPRALRDQSVRELIGSLGRPADVARAAVLLLEQVEADTLPEFVAELCDAAGEGAGDLAPLLDELLLHDDLSSEIMNELRDLRARMPHARPMHEASTMPPRRTVLHGTDGARQVVLVAHRDRVDRTVMRTVVVRIDGDVLASMTHEPALPATRGFRKLCDDLAHDGFDLEPATIAEVAPIVARAVRAGRKSGEALPREYFLGRDLLGLYDEHVTSAAADHPRRIRARRPSGRERLGLSLVTGNGGARLLERGIELFEGGEAERAQTVLAEYVEQRPDDAEGRSWLASCLLELSSGKPTEPGRNPMMEEALRHFASAARLEPEDPLRFWNLASAAKRAGKAGVCYLALLTYRRLAADLSSEADRSRTARQFIRMFERFARLEHPSCTPETVARGEELFDRAFEHLQEARFQDAVSGFEAVLKLVPSHYPSWGNLGAAHLQLNQRTEAETCLRKALEFRPDYEVARRNLNSLEERT